ncbi:ABC transporter permease [Dyadobacter sandarakinus]|uniref:ABC transporter permease n=2 Tax=Dyadobacter sandarakinus TaxID=2747268 RepID=A0ABX7IDY9_9BACT|nr:ABC transporter permease [Dyadobacter sandarakinus]
MKNQNLPRQPHPPNWLVRLATAICAPHLREELIGDMHERFTVYVSKYGGPKARLLFARETLGLVRWCIVRRQSAGFAPAYHFRMLRNYFRIGRRVLIKNRGYTLIHLTGLALGLWACMIVATVVIDSLSYDRQWTHADDIYRVIHVRKMGEGLLERSTSSPAALPAEMQKLFPEVVSWSSVNGYDYYFKVHPDDPAGHTTHVLSADSGIVGMLGIKVVAGSLRTDGNNLALTRSVAGKLFPGQDAIGRTLWQIPKYGDKANAYQVTALIEDLPYNSHLRTDAIHLNQTKPQVLSNTGYMSFERNYILLHPRTNAASLARKVNKWYTGFMKGNDLSGFEFQPVKDVYLHSDFAEGQSVRADANSIYIFMGVAALLLFIACVNFVNLSTARAFTRIKEASVRKILSGSRMQLIMQSLAETLTIFAVAVAIAMIAYFFSLQEVEGFLGHHLVQTFTTHTHLAAWAVLLVLITALFTGIYPAWLISGFKPSHTLRGLLSHTFGLNTLRKGLVVMQFSISIVVLLATIVVWRQLSLMEHKDLGYDKKNLLSIDQVSWDGKGAAFKSELLRIAGAQRASISLWRPTDGGGYMSKEVDDPADTKSRIRVWFIAGDLDLAETLGLRLSGGRLLSPGFGADAINADSMQRADFGAFEQAATRQSSLITRSAARILNIKTLNRMIPSAKTVPVGMIDDFNNESLYEPIKPTIIVGHRDVQYGGMFIRITPGTEKQTTRAIRSLWKKFYPAKMLTINPVEELLSKQYEAEGRLRQLFLFFSGLTMFLSALGIFGLVVQAGEQRSKEMSIRKVLGASVTGIVTLLTKDFVRLVVFAILLATPVGWYTLQNWLERYPYRTQLHWWIFAVTGAGALFITVLTVGVQAARTALSNPVKSLRNE